MSELKDEEYYGTYVQESDDPDHEFDLDEGDCEDGKDDNVNAVIITTEDNSYYQISEYKSATLDDVADYPTIIENKLVKAMPGNKRSTAQSTTDTSKKSKLKKIHESKKPSYTEIEVKSANVSASSENANEEGIYEFDENEQYTEDPQDMADADYKSKGVIKKVEKSKANEGGAFKCVVCAYKTEKKFLLSRHLKSHCDIRPFNCSVCERSFKTKSSLINHRNTHLGHKPHACSSCDMAFVTSGELLRHVRYRHTHIKPHKCSECDYSSVELSKLRRHMRCHTGERPYQCPHCTYASPDSFKLKRHMRTHTGEKPYECDICNARFTQSNSLKQHRLIHSVNDKPVFQCHLCPTTCGRKTDLRMHIKKLHTSLIPIPCKRCGKELPDRYSYKMHIKTHEGEKCYRCDYCSYASISPRHLESHILIHLDAKPFTCDICSDSFRQKGLLARHIKLLHTDNYEPPQPRKKDHKCPHCYRMYANNGNLIRHMATHDPTSRLREEKEKLRIGRMKRVKEDGTVVMAMPANNSTLFDESEKLYCDETEEQQVNDEDYQAEYEDIEECNEDNIQYVYDEYEADECEEQQEEEHYEEKRDETNIKTLIIDVKQEKIKEMDVDRNIHQKSVINLKREEQRDSQLMLLDQHDEVDFMVIEVLPDDEEEEQELEQVKPEVKSTIVIKKENNSVLKKSQQNSQSPISGYFGFEVDDEEDEETRGVIKLIEVIRKE